METAEVTHDGAPPSNVSDKGQGGKKDETVTIPKAQWEAVQRERDEAKQSERFWASKAKPTPEPEPEEDEPIETDDLVPAVTGNDGADEAIFNDPDKWTDAISKGPAAVEAFLRKSGYVTAREAAEIAVKAARQTVQVERQKMTTDAQILGEFPELKDDDSELFKATSKELKALFKIDPNFARTPAALYAAARAAKAGLKPAPKPRNEDDGDDDYDRYEDEQDRRRRADSQDTTRSRGRPEVEDDDMLGPEAKEVMRQMGISREEFIESRKQTAGMRRKR